MKKKKKIHKPKVPTRRIELGDYWHDLEIRRSTGSVNAKP